MKPVKLKRIMTRPVRVIEQVREQRKESKIYSDIDSLPFGKASTKLTPGCVVIEGGAFRGLYNQGVLDAMMLNDINFQTTIGVSAGALAGLNYVSGQIGRSARANLGHRHESSYIGVKALAKSRSPLRLDYLLQDYNQIEPLDESRFLDPNRRYVAVATNCRTGKAEYFEKGICADILSAIKASASMPYISPMVLVNGIPCLDGGCSCKIAYQWALDQGYEKIVIIRTREHGFRKEVKESHLATKFYKKYPSFAKSLDQSDADYNKQCDRCDELGASGRAFLIEPSEPVTVGRVEPDMEKLGNLYWLGFNDMLANLDKLKEYLVK